MYKEKEKQRERDENWPVGLNQGKKNDDDDMARLRGIRTYIYFAVGSNQPCNHLILLFDFL